MKKIIKLKNRRPKLLSAASVRYLEAKARLAAVSDIMRKVGLGKEWLRAADKKNAAWCRLNEAEKDEAEPNRIKP